MTEIRLQIGIRNQAGRVSRMVASWLLAQHGQPLFEESPGLSISASALVRARQVDAQRSVLLAKIFGIGLRIVNSARLLEVGNREVVIAQKSEDAAQRVEA